MGGILAVTLWVLSRTAWNVSKDVFVGQSTSAIGKSLLTTYVLPFEVVSVVLIAALIGAIVIARRD